MWVQIKSQFGSKNSIRVKPSSQSSGKERKCLLFLQHQHQHQHSIKPAKANQPSIGVERCVTSLVQVLLSPVWMLPLPSSVFCHLCPEWLWGCRQWCPLPPITLLSKQAPPAQVPTPHYLAVTAPSPKIPTCHTWFHKSINITSFLGRPTSF